MKKRINISIDTEIHEQAQRHAFRRGISLSNFIETELCRAMKNPQETTNFDYPSAWSQLDLEQRQHLIQYMNFLIEKSGASDLPFAVEGIGKL
jgi:hypothetical protein